MRFLSVMLIPSLLQAQHQGLTPAASARQDSVERALLAVPDTQSARVMTHDLARVPHMAGTPAQAATRDYVVDKMKGWGLETWTKSYDVYLPHPDTTAAWLIAPGGKPVALDLREPVVPGDSTSRDPQVMPFNGSTGIGDVTGDVVYVGYGLIDDC